MFDLMYLLCGILAISMILLVCGILADYVLPVMFPRLDKWLCDLADRMKDE